MSPGGLPWIETPNYITSGRQMLVFLSILKSVHLMAQLGRTWFSGPQVRRCGPSAQNGQNRDPASTFRAGSSGEAAGGWREWGRQETLTPGFQPEARGSSPPHHHPCTSGTRPLLGTHCPSFIHSESPTACLGAGQRGLLPGVCVQSWAKTQPPTCSPPKGAGEDGGASPHTAHTKQQLGASQAKAA